MGGCKDNLQGSSQHAKHAVTIWNPLKRWPWDATTFGIVHPSSALPPSKGGDGQKGDRGGGGRTRKRHQQEHQPQRPTESSNPTQPAKGRMGDCPGPRKGATTRRNVTQGGGGDWSTGCGFVGQNGMLLLLLIIAASLASCLPVQHGLKAFRPFGCCVPILNWRH